MGRITRRERARTDLIKIWDYISDSDEMAADRMLDRFEEALAMLSDNPLAGRERPELAPGLRSFPVRSYVLFYMPVPGGIDLVRVRSGYLDLAAEDFGG
jgi:toxin ParE1/3/4